MPLRLKPVKMKNSLYLLVPKGLSELLELDERDECVLTTEKEGRNPVLKYTFQPGAGVHREPGRDAPQGRGHPPKSVKVLEAGTA